MQILFYILIIISSILGAVVGGSGFILGLVAEADESWGWIVAFCGLVYLVHPALVYWLFKNVHEMLAMGVVSLFIVSSTVLVLFL